MKTDRRGFLLAAAAAAGCRSGRRGPARKLTVGLGSYHTMSPFYLAYERGYFHDAGLDIQTHVARNTSEAMPLLAQGALDVGLFSLSSGLCNLVAKGAPIRIAAARDCVAECVDVAVLYERKASFPHGDDAGAVWEGKRVALPQRGAVSDYWFDVLRERLKLPPRAVHKMYMDRAAGLAALLSGGVDAMLNGFAFPIDLGARSGEFLRNDTVGHTMQGSQFSYIMFSRKLIEDDPELGADFLRAFFRGTREYVAGATPAFLRNWASENGMDPEAVAHVCRNTVVPGGTVDVADLQKFLDWLADSHYIQPMRAEALADSRWLERVRRKNS
jgi:NitT/TauT family transport system substrate-binding protein